MCQGLTVLNLHSRKRRKWSKVDGGYKTLMSQLFSQRMSIAR